MSLRTFIAWYRDNPDSPPDEVMARYDVIIGGGCPPERRERIRKTNPRVRFLTYVNVIDLPLVAGIDDVAALGASPPRSGGDFIEDIWRNHRDFLLKTRAGAKGTTTDPRRMYVWGYQALFDPSSRSANRFHLDPRSGWKDYFAERCAEIVREGGWDGVMVDNAGARCDWSFSRIADPELRPEIDDAEWGRAMSALLANVSRRVKEACPGAMVTANTCGDFVRSDGDDAEPTAFFRDSLLDGAIEEFFGHAQGANRPSYVTGARWREQIRSILCCERMGRSYLALANGAPENHAARTYALASFLLAAGDHSCFTYNPAAGPTYPLVYRLSEFDLDLGRPLAAHECLSGIYVRRFERGLVLVNPGDREATVDLPAGLRRMDLSRAGLAGDRAGCSFSLPSSSAAIWIRD